MNEEFQIGAGVSGVFPVNVLTPEEEAFLSEKTIVELHDLQTLRVKATMPEPQREEESYGDQLEALEQKLDDLLTFMARLTPLVEFAEKMMLTTTKKEKLKLFMGMGGND